jgi:hypothetical protein
MISPREEGRIFFISTPNFVALHQSIVARSSTAAADATASSAGHLVILFCIVLLSAAQNKKIGNETSVIESRFCRRTLTHGCNVKNLVTETESHTTIINGLFFID